MCIQMADSMLDAHRRGQGREQEKSRTEICCCVCLLLTAMHMGEAKVGVASAHCKIWL